MASVKKLLAGMPPDLSDGGASFQARGNNSSSSNPTIKLRVIASYVILTMLSTYVIYDYRIRPDCICRPRPYVFALTSFALTGFYGLLGIFNKVFTCDKPCGSNCLNKLIYILEMFLVLPLFASEVWVSEKVFKCHPEMVHFHMVAAIPGVANYVFHNNQSSWMMDISWLYSICTLIYLGIYQKVYWAVSAGAMYTIGYLFAEKTYLMPRFDCLNDEEIINYCLTGFLLCADKYLV